jgi:hypothetical protein
MEGAKTMPKEVGSPINTRVRDSERRGESPSVRSDRAGGHLTHLNKGGPTPQKLMRRGDSDLSLQTSVASKMPPPIMDRRR